MPRSRAWNASASVRERAHHVSQPVDHAGHAVVVELVGCVRIGVMEPEVFRPINLEPRAGNTEREQRTNVGFSASAYGAFPGRAQTRTS